MKNRLFDWLWKRESSKIEPRNNGKCETGHCQENPNDTEIVKAIKSISNEIRTAKQRNKASEKNKNQRECYTVVSTVVTGAATIVLAIFNIGLWSETHDMVKEMQSSSQQTDQTIAILKDGQRAWIAPLAMQFTGEIGADNTASLQLTYRNTGKEPALDYTSAYDPVFVQPPEKKIGWSWNDIKVPVNSTCDRIPLPIPKAPSVYPSESNGSIEFIKGNIGDSDKQNVETGTSVMLIMGCIAYVTFEEIHHSGFCFMAIPNIGKPLETWQLRQCPGGHKAD